MRKEKQIVKKFYETFGWEKSSSGVYQDTLAFVDRRPVLDAYRHKTNMRAVQFLHPDGHLYLDAGSGAIPAVELLESSSGYGKRVCVDFSTKALAEARDKLGKRGLYVQADLTQLPFRDNVFDATMCAHVLYHIPPEEQVMALRELHRTLRTGRCAVILYCFSTSVFTRLGEIFGRSPTFARFRGMLSRLFGNRASGRRAAAHVESAAASNEEKGGLPPLFFVPQDRKWLKRILPRDWDTDVRCWQSVDMGFTTTFVSSHLLGETLMAAIFAMENLLPHFMARLGRYPMIIIRK